MIAAADAVVRAELRAAIGSVNAQIVELCCGDSLERFIAERPADLVAAAAELPKQSAMQVLGRLRARENPTPFLIVQPLREPWFRVFVSHKGERDVLSTRTLDRRNLAALVARVVEYSLQERAAKVTRPPSNESSR